MALSLPKAKTLTVTASDGTTDQAIELTTKVGQMNPLLVIPSILDLIRNTSVSPSTGEAVNTRIYGMTKNAYFDITNSDGTALANDPRSHATDAKDVLIKQLSPRMVGAKYGNISWDLEAEGLEDLLSRSLGQHLMERRIIKEQAILAEAATAAEAVVITGTPTTFATGAHVVKKTITTSDEAYTEFSSAIANYQKIGLDSAAAKENKEYAHARGINKQDAIVLMTPEFEALLLAKEGVFASQIGNALFQAAGLKMVLGMITTTAVTLPAGKNFMILSTGINGALSHEQIAVGTNGKVIIDPDWSFAKRLDLVDAFTLGIVYPFQIFVQENAVTTNDEPDEVIDSVVLSDDDVVVSKKELAKQIEEFKKLSKELKDLKASSIKEAKEKADKEKEEADKAAKELADKKAAEEKAKENK